MTLPRRAVAALGAVITGLVLGAAPTSSASTPPNHECWGASLGVWPQFHAAVPASGCVRIYADTEDKFPATWPAVAPGAWSMLSIRPSYAGLMTSAAEQARIRGLCVSAPAHALLTMWHENAGANPLNYPPDVHNAANYVAMQRKMEELCAGTHVRFGVVIIAPFSGVLSWLYRGDDWFGYDFYAFDRYLNHGLQAQAEGGSFVTATGTINVAAVLSRMNANLAAVRQITGRTCPPMMIAETNASKDSQRQTWFNTLGGWFAHHDCHREGWVLTRWTPCPPGTPHCGLSGPWPPSKEVVADLARLAETYR